MTEPEPAGVVNGDSSDTAHNGTAGTVSFSIRAAVTRRLRESSQAFRGDGSGFTRPANGRGAEQTGPNPVLI